MLGFFEVRGLQDGLYYLAAGNLGFEGVMLVEWNVVKNESSTRLPYPCLGDYISIPAFALDVFRHKGPAPLKVNRALILNAQRNLFSPRKGAKVEGTTITFTPVICAGFNDCYFAPSYFLVVPTNTSQPTQLTRSISDLL